MLNLDAFLSIDKHANTLIDSLCLLKSQSEPIMPNRFSRGVDSEDANLSLLLQNHWVSSIVFLKKFKTILSPNRLVTLLTNIFANKESFQF